jgi:two-component SAPR family response regulator
MNLDVVVVIDDDAVVLFLHKILIKKSPIPATVKDFLDAGKALEYISQLRKDENILIFLDINMPGINGWDFLSSLEQIPASENIFVVMVTSSINSSDRTQAEKFPHVIDYHEKPLSKQACEEIYMKLLPRLKS